MSLSVSQKVQPNISLRERLAISFGITDEVFAVSMQRKQSLSSVYMAGLIITPVLGWTAGTTFGAVASQYMPSILTNSMGIALYGMFIAIIIPPARENKNISLAIIMSVILSIAFNYLPLLQCVSDGWTIIIITVLVSAICATFFPIKSATVKEVNYEL